MHAIGAAIQLSMVMLSCIGEVLCTAANGAMCGDSLRASRSLNFCVPLTRMRGPDALPTARARKCHISCGLALVWLALCHDACMSCLSESVFPLRNYNLRRLVVKKPFIWR